MFGTRARSSADILATGSLLPNRELEDEGLCIYQLVQDMSDMFHQQYRCLDLSEEFLVEGHS